MQFKTRYNCRSESDGMTFVKPSLTIQSEYPMTTVDFYLNRYAATGILGNPNKALQGQFGDFSELQDFQKSQNLIAKTRQSFEALPSFIRAQFEHSVDRYVEFLADPANRDKAIEMGLLVADTPTASVELPEVPTVSADPVETPVSDSAQSPS